MFSKKYFSVFVFLCVVSNSLMKELPDYIQVCKRDPSTIDNCIRKSIEILKPKLISGIPELNVPSIDPFFISEIKVATVGSVPIHASGRNIKVTGAGDFKIKSLSVDLETLTFKGRVMFPKLHFDGHYKIDTHILGLPLKGEGMLKADAVRSDAELVIHTQVCSQDGVEYMRFTKFDTDINIKDYHVRLDGLFNGNKVLGNAANAVINQNRMEFLRTLKPNLEKTVSKNFLDIANKIVDGLPLDQLLPKP